MWACLFLEFDSFPMQLLQAVLSFPSLVKVPKLLHSPSHFEGLLLLGSQHSSLCAQVLIRLILTPSLCNGYNSTISYEIRKLGAGRIFSASSHTAGRWQGKSILIPASFK